LADCFVVPPRKDTLILGYASRQVGTTSRYIKD
jgi:hypothetical protein